MPCQRGRLAVREDEQAAVLLDDVRDRHRRTARVGPLHRRDLTPEQRPRVGDVDPARDHPELKPMCDVPPKAQTWPSRSSTNP